MITRHNFYKSPHHSFVHASHEKKNTIFIILFLCFE